MIPQTSFRNSLITHMPAKGFDLLSPHLSARPFDLRKTIEEPDQPVETICFPESGMISMVAVGRTGRSVEVGLIGLEGMTGLSVVMGVNKSPQKSFVQMEGNGHCISADDLREAMEANPALRVYLLRYAQSFFNQVANTVLANGLDTLEQRLSRWLLMGLDRVDGMRLPLTHEFLALMLGVRRPGVTTAIHGLEGRGLIKADRANFVVIDREGLEISAGEAYQAPKV
jgi:CRP-like cAMP-binding protein